MTDRAISMRLDAFPPYGALPFGFAEQVERPAAPLDFVSENKGVDEWFIAIGEVEGVINRFLWPSWDRVRARWRNPNIALMNALTEADFAILRDYQESNWLLERSPESSVANAPRHFDFFIDEDEGRIGHRLSSYSDELRLEGTDVAQLWTPIFERKIGHAAMLLKDRLQRPRPHQIALLAQLDAFRWHTANTSHSPSMCSGHAFQGLMFAAGLCETLSAMGVLTPAARSGLAQFGVDVGDRRVFAGIHYPSDNIASWIAIAVLARRVFRPETIEFLHFAVTCSEVYRRLLDAQAIHPVLTPALRHVETMLSHSS